MSLATSAQLRTFALGSMERIVAIRGLRIRMRIVRVPACPPTFASGMTRRSYVSRLAIGAAFADVEVSSGTLYAERRPRVTLQCVTTVQPSESMSAFAA